MNSTIKKTTLFLGACMAFQLGGIPQMLAAPILRWKSCNKQKESLVP